MHLLMCKCINKYEFHYTFFIYIQQQYMYPHYSMHLIRSVRSYISKLSRRLIDHRLAPVCIIHHVPDLWWHQIVCGQPRRRWIINQGSAAFGFVSLPNTFGQFLEFRWACWMSVEYSHSVDSHAGKSLSKPTKPYIDSYVAVRPSRAVAYLWRSRIAYIDQSAAAYCFGRLWQMAGTRQLLTGGQGF